MSEHDLTNQELTRAITEMIGEGNLSSFDLFRQMKITGHLLTRLTGADTEEGRISSARMRLLMRLALHHRLTGEGLSPSEISRFLGVSRNTVSSLLNGLEEQGLVTRDLHPTDRRQFIITLTPEGQRLHATHAPRFAHYMKNVFSALTPDEQATLLDLLKKLNTGMCQMVECHDQPAGAVDDPPEETL